VRLYTHVFFMATIDEDYLETHFEIVKAIVEQDQMEELCGIVYQRRIDYGYGGLYELAKELTDEFQEMHKDRVWDGDFADEIESFLEEKNKQL
jgi:hypothetical protein